MERRAFLGRLAAGATVLGTTRGAFGAGDTLKVAWHRDRSRFGELFPSAIEMIQGAVRDLKALIGEFSRSPRF